MAPGRVGSSNFPVQNTVWSSLKTSILICCEQLYHLIIFPEMLSLKSSPSWLLPLLANLMLVKVKKVKFRYETLTHEKSNPAWTVDDEPSSFFVILKTRIASPLNILVMKALWTVSDTCKTLMTNKTNCRKWRFLPSNICQSNILLGANIWHSVDTVNQRSPLLSRREHQ